MKIYFETLIPGSVKEIKNHFSESLFKFLKPPGVELTIERFDGCKKGDEVHLKMKLFKVPQKWVSLMTEEVETQTSWYFIDEGKVLPPPIFLWRHKHLVEKRSETESAIIDDIFFETSPKFLGPVIYPVIYAMFSLRPKLYKKFFKEHL